MRHIKFIVIHCSAGHGDLASVKRFWKDTLKWKTGGYHKWVDYDGSITDLYDLNTVTNGVRGFNNHSIHICYRGGINRATRKAEDTRTEDQKAGLLNAIHQVLTQLKQTQNVNGIVILGHRDFSTDQNKNGVIESWERIKECPCFDTKPEYKWITVQ
jgi:N-acetylmuramoyl-L-alanine amidase